MSDKQPIATFFAGVNGCGKTTLYYNELEKGNSFGFRINIDEIVSAFGDWRKAQDQIRAARIALTMRNQYINQRQSFNQETTLCGKGIINLFKKLKAEHYDIRLYYISVDSIQTAIERVKIRVSKGGHNVDSNLIERRFYETRKNLTLIGPYCDTIQMLENTRDGFILQEDNLQAQSPKPKRRTR